MLADDQIYNLMLEIGSKHGIPIARPDEGTAYHFDYDKKFNLSIEVSEDKGQVALQSRLHGGQSGDSNLYKKLLQANFLCLDTQGATFALDPVTGDICLCRLISLQELDAIIFEKSIESFLGAADKWHTNIDQPPEHAGNAANDARPVGAPHLTVISSMA